MPLSSSIVDSAAYAVILDEASATVTYVGEAEVGSSTSNAVWRIKKITTSGTITLIQFADGDTSFDNIWDNRVSLTYN